MGAVVYMARYGVGLRLGILLLSSNSSFHFSEINSPMAPVWGPRQARYEFIGTIPTYCTQSFKILQDGRIRGYQEEAEEPTYVFEGHSRNIFCLNSTQFGIVISGK